MAAKVVDDGGPETESTMVPHIGDIRPEDALRDPVATLNPCQVTLSRDGSSIVALDSSYMAREAC